MLSSALLDQQQSPKTESGLRDSLWLASIETRQYRAGGNIINQGGQRQLWCAFVYDSSFLKLLFGCHNKGRVGCFQTLVIHYPRGFARNWSAIMRYFENICTYLLLKKNINGTSERLFIYCA